MMKLLMSTRVASIILFRCQAQMTREEVIADVILAIVHLKQVF